MPPFIPCTSGYTAYQSCSSQINLQHAGPRLQKCSRGQNKFTADPGVGQDQGVLVQPQRERRGHCTVCLRQLAARMGGGSGFQSGDPAVDIPGQIPPRQRDALRPGTAEREDSGDAPCAAGVAAGAQQPGGPQQEEGGRLALLWRYGLQHSLE